MSAESGDPGVKKPFDLRLISDADLKREADKIRKAKALAEERDQLSRTPLGPAAGTSPDRLRAVPKAVQRGQDRKSAITANRTENKFQEAVRKQKEAEIALKKAQRDLEKKQKQLDQKVQGFIDRGGNFFENPESAIQNEILQLATKAGPAGLAITLLPQIIQQILLEFEDGGVFDTRIKEQSEVRTIGSLDYLIDIQNGTVLFTESAYLDNEPPGVTNTDRLVAGQMRFYLFNADNYTGIIDDG